MTSAAKGRAALYCALFSLGWGVAVFLLWTATRWHRLEEIGALWLGGGTLLVLVGSGFLYLARFGQDPIPGRRALLIFLLLVGNFPAAAGIIVLVHVIKFPTIDVDLGDVTQKQKISMGTRIEQPNSLLVHVRGRLEGRGRVRLDQGSDVLLGPGPVDMRIHGGDFYNPRTILTYEPEDVRGGKLVVTYQFQ